jgi:hypothetical protein
MLSNKILLPLLLKIFPTHYHLPSVFEQIINLGYDGYFLNQNNYQSLDSFSEIMQSTSAVNYVNNFIFKPKY